MYIVKSQIESNDKRPLLQRNASETALTEPTRTFTYTGAESNYAAAVQNGLHI